MTRSILLAILLLVPAFPAHAQQDVPTPQAERAREQIDEIEERLKLTPEQVEQVRPILEDAMERLAAAREKHSGGSRRSRLQLARELRDIRESTDEALEKVLTKEQMAELKKIRDERREALRERSGR